MYNITHKSQFPTVYLGLLIEKNPLWRSFGDATKTFFDARSILELLCFSFCDALPKETATRVQYVRARF